MKKILILMVVFLMVNAGDVLAKKLYKWVDQNGQVHYSHQVPPDQIKKKHEELNKDGVVLEKIGRVKNAEELKQDELKRQRMVDEQKKAMVLEKQRKVVIQSYTNESEIMRLKDERIFALQRNIELARQSLDFQKNSKEQLLAMAADNERNGIEVSNALKSRINTIKEKIDYQMKFIETKEDEINKVEEKFVKDLKVYREATNVNKQQADQGR